MQTAASADNRLIIGSPPAADPFMQFVQLPHGWGTMLRSNKKEEKKGEEVKMREIIFDAEFWPTMNTRLQTDLGKDLHTGAKFWEDFTQTLTMLAAYDTDMLCADYDKFPAAVPIGRPPHRIVSLKTFNTRGEDQCERNIKIHFRLEDGNKLKIIGITGVF